ncbi:MAG TPA: protein tyrosine phosphatase family protein [Burkholderiaceae bacterium]|jgi:protein tyrosine phosphatase (PTP) superfamily phosphohydrolase (DUF442 family)|nr:protein tyrosine phosphatase family protein [Burkholderiaceae bacterium]
MARCARWKTVFAALIGMLTASLAQSHSTLAPNRVDINPRLVTSGQPPAEALASLRVQGFDAVIYLAPPTVSDAIRDEALIVAKQGLTFVNIPIKFDEPTEKDFEAFTSVLSALSMRKVLVHCQINLRASVMVFLHRVITAQEDPRVAYDAVAKVWSPDGTWKTLMRTLLSKNGVTFEPY